MLATKSISLNDFLSRTKSHPIVIKGEQIFNIHNVDSYLNQKYLEGEQIVLNAQKRSAEIEKATIRHTETQFWKKIEPLLENLNTLNDEIFSQIEQHCSGVVKLALKRLLLEIPSSHKINAVVAEVISELKPDTLAKILVNPDQFSMVEPIIGYSQIKVVQDPSIAINSCTMHVQGNQFHSSFEGTLELLIKQLGKDRQPQKELTP